MRSSLPPLDEDDTTNGGTSVAALIATDAADVRFRDPDNVAAGYFVLVGSAAALLVGLDVAIKAARMTGTRRPSRALCARFAALAGHGSGWGRPAVRS